MPPQLSAALNEWNHGVFFNELQRKNISLPLPASIITIHPKRLNYNKPQGPPAFKEGTFHGTAMALTEMYSRVIKRHCAYFDIAGIEEVLPTVTPQSDARDLHNKREKYEWQPAGIDLYPPHLRLIPRIDRVDQLHIFNAARLLDVIGILSPIVPESIKDWWYGKPSQGSSIADVQAHYFVQRKTGGGIYDDATIGDRVDWYTDAVFAQQQFTGPNPTTITLASPDWVSQFQKAAESQGNDAVHAILSEGLSDNPFYIQDYSYFRQATGAAADAVLTSSEGPDGTRYGCASVILFRLYPDGKLHPLAIVIDYKGSIEKSVVIFNKRLEPSDQTDSEEEDWPWRYAKTCAQVSDWTRHELTVHLTNTHLIEEAIIVAAERSFPTGHGALNLLHPHWLKTLSLNASARATLVPDVITKISGLKGDEVYAFIRNAYQTFHFTDNYVPNDLRRRGFPPEELQNNGKFHNYAYARNIILMWETLRTFVSNALKEVAPQYNTDASVASDSYIKTWVSEMQDKDKANISSFPTIKTREELVDALTMCIHIASPQHTAVNYLQEYYQSFVINKPPALYASPPQTLQKLQGYTENDLVAALPINKPLQWLLAMQLPYLLSYQVAADQNILNYALSLTKNSSGGLQTVANNFYNDLQVLAAVFEKHSAELDDKTVKYNVMGPDVTAVSILI